MNIRKKNEFVPYELMRPGFEALYTGDTKLPPEDSFQKYGQDENGNVFTEFSSWGFANMDEEKWTDEIKHINSMQTRLGVLDDSTRKIRAQISSLQCCDSGIPVTIDEILGAIGTGILPDHAFHPGCWLSLSSRTTQPMQQESMVIIEKVIKEYLEGRSEAELLEENKYASGFITRTFDWLGPVDKLSRLQKLMIERFLLPFDYITGRTDDHESINNICYEIGSRGESIDAQISAIAELPRIYANYKSEFHECLNEIRDEEKRELYKVCCAMAHGLHGLSDCHHSTFRWIESWIHGIGKFSMKIPDRKAGVEGIRLGHLQFGYALGIDRWLQGTPMQWLLLDIGHIDLGFDPKNEILRVYAYLREKDPVKKWLSACLWFTLVLERPASLCDWGWRHKELLRDAQAKGIKVTDWITFS